MIIVSAIVVTVFLALLAYWQLIIAEGTYLGQGVVTWLYDLAAYRYDSIKGFDEEIEAIFVGRPLAETLHEEDAPLVLDIGTGTARLPITLLAQPSFQGIIMGVDDSLRMLAVARGKTQQYKDRLWLIWKDAAALPLRGNAFDAVTCLEMLEFTPCPAGQLAEAVRVLKPGGVLLTTRRRGFDAWLMPGKTYSRTAFERLLSGLGVQQVRTERWQVDYDLVWGLKAGESMKGVYHPLDVLLCSHCHEAALAEQSDALVCSQCGAWYPVRDGIIDFNGAWRR